MTRRCSVTIGDNARHNDSIVAVGLLQQALSAGGKIIGHVGPSETEPVVVDHVEVGLLARGYDAAVAETGGIGSIACQPTYQLFDPEAPTFATPVCQQPCGKARIQDETNVGTAIAKSHDRVPISEHGLGCRQFVVVIIDNRCVEEVATAVLDEDVVSHFGSRATLTRSYGGH